MPVVYFFMIGCPHCDATKPTIEKMKGKGIKIQEKESRDVVPSDGVSSFPTIVVIKGGKEVKRVEGSRTDADALIKELGLSSGGRRRRTHRRRSTRRKRTLRNYKALV